MTGTIRMSARLLIFILAGTIYGTSQNVTSSDAKEFSAITIHKTCEAMVPDQCQGLYGFSVAGDGKFTVGPDRNGNIVEGNITSDELKTLTSAVNSQLASGDKQICMDIRVVGGVTEVVAASFTDGTNVNLFTAGLVPGANGGRCVLGDYQKAQRVEQNVRNLLAKYYPRPFPGVADAGPE